MNRRDLLEPFGAVLPFELQAGLTIVDIKILDSFREILTTSRQGNGLIVTLDPDDLWRYVRLMDSDDNDWHTDDNGATWKHGTDVVRYRPGGSFA